MFLFEEVVNSINLKLESLSSHWDLATTKKFPEKENANLKAKAKDLKSTAIKLASVYFPMSHYCITFDHLALPISVRMFQ